MIIVALLTTLLIRFFLKVGVRFELENERVKGLTNRVRNPLQAGRSRSAISMKLSLLPSEQYLGSILYGLRLGAPEVTQAARDSVT